MKNFTVKLISFITILCLAFTGFAQRRGGSSFGSSSGFGGGRSSAPAYRPSSGSSFRPSSGSPFGGGRQQTYRPAPSNYRQNTSSTVNRPSTTTTRMSYRTSYRVGYRPSLSIHYYGNPYGYMGHMLYWYGGGYYAYTPGGPLMLGNPGMPGYAQQPVVVVQNGPGAMFLGMIALMVVVIIALIVGFIANN